jgi:cytochrome c oxidase cbb3-type subunit II
MSDLAAAAAALGLPEVLVQRSAEARAAETGASVDDILSQWAGGEATPAAAPAEAAAQEAPPAEETDEEAAAPAGEPPAPEVVIEEPARSPEPAAAPAGPYKPPVLVGARDNPMTILAGVVGVFLIVVLVGLVGPSIRAGFPGARSSHIDYSDAALDGQDVYAATGCAACHTQMIRPIVADVGLGPVTLNDTNQVLGTRRFGPDLADVGARLSQSQIEATIAGLGDHPAHNLNPEELSDLVAYLSESATSSNEEES